MTFLAFGTLFLQKAPSNPRESVPILTKASLHQKSPGTSGSGARCTSLRRRVLLLQRLFDFFGILDQLAESVCHEGSDPGREHADDDDDNADKNRKPA